jgi:hypothetical protein
MGKGKLLSDLFLFFTSSKVKLCLLGLKIKAKWCIIGKLRFLIIKMIF